jgi:phage terminase large subunit
MDLQAKIRKVFQFLFDETAGYLVSYDGRGAGKSVNIAKVILIKAAQRRTLVFCTRELQSSIKDSVHKLSFRSVRKAWHAEQSAPFWRQPNSSEYELGGG